ncbi:MAG: type II toxin-antitoxin system VapC family toxin [Vulcanimicrobiaceae bacterium]
MILVLDASITASWIFADERDAYATQVAEKVAAGRGLVPALWRWEIQNVLLSAHRAKRINETELAQYVSDLQELNIEVDLDPKFGVELSIARHHGLTVYDAAYLELAMRRNCKLATKDDELRRAAESAGLYLS